MWRNRILLFFILGCVFAWSPYRQYLQSQERCAQQQGVASPPARDLYNTQPDTTGGCLDREPLSLWARGLGMLSGACFAAFFVFLLQGLAARRRERMLLQQAGIPVQEADLPLEE